ARRSCAAPPGAPRSGIDVPGNRPRRPPPARRAAAPGQLRRGLLSIPDLGARPGGGRPQPDPRRGGLPLHVAGELLERLALRRAVASCGMVYLSIRLLDDVLDRHFLYRGKKRTLLASLSDLPEGGQASTLTHLAGVLLCLHGILGLIDAGDAGDAGALLGQE